ncbi:LCM-domain-containing protein [Massarina eburnea CBS 473.64]|uniref:tRNA wybutosine-synthesizing protein 4 n=1 Tax=Massarina eburnea CBS 473.64 TaxID=1395130 RepID=A0A6A6SDN3_9PLEO|nr:LCM-domain-containing protein [Massarina eburnea CBS 473.64]
MSAAKKPKKKVAAKSKGKGKARSAQERNDDDIMHTNDSSITSKRCVSKLYFPNEPDFYEPFVPRYMRRNPLINRGYWLRMHAVEQAVVDFLKEEAGRQKVIVNLGCGYDPLPFQFWHRHVALSQHAIFVDVDYPQLIARKRDRMLTNDTLREALLKTNLRPSQAPVFVRSDRYIALGCDLRDLVDLGNLLKTEPDLIGSPILFLAEVSLTYMPTTDSDALIRWASALGDARFCLLEQYLPQGPDHPFAQTMLKHFDKLQTPIQAVQHYPSLSQQASRFKNAGWSSIKSSCSLWDLWSDDGCTPPAVRSGLDEVEPFDEWEEFALFAGHYFMIVASNATKEDPIEPTTICQSNTDAQGHSGMESRPMTIILHSAKTTSQPDPRRFGAAFTIGNNTVAFHSGQGLQCRLSSMDVLQRNNLASVIQPCDSTPQARMCHTVTSLDHAAALLVGGRASPAQAFADCWLYKQGAWEQVHDLSPARFRHSAVKVIIPSDDPNESKVQGVLVFGGKTSDGTVLDECTLWTAAQGWTTIPVNGRWRPPARFGSAISTLGLTQGSGYLMGGMAPCGTVLEDVWEWRITLAPKLHLEFTDRTNDVHKANASLTYGRFGASLVPYGNSLLLIGGVSKKEIGNFHEAFAIITPHVDGNTIRVEQPTVSLPESAWPLLVGAGVASVSRDEIVVAGGGAVCFSMGSFWNEGYLIITADTAGAQAWSSPVCNTNIEARADVPSLIPNTKGTLRPKAKRPDGPKPTVIPRVQLNSKEEFASLLAASKPAVIEGQSVGACRELWTLDYLKQKMGAEREVVIHECSSDRMTFKDKNFQYIKQPFVTFIDGITGGAKTYLRAISSTQANKLPTKLEDDFSEIADDFHLPDTFAFVKDNLHSSPLRISGPVALWLHYDVLANILCQIQGSKTLHLYPPSDVKSLSYPPGGSSSNVDVHNPSSKDAYLLRKTHPHIASLSPGDILFIPPMWSHTAKPEEGSSVAVNVFFKNLDTGYAAGKDVYGNRDLQAYENGRRDVEKIVRAFRNVPGDMARFYLDRLAAEIQDKADGIGKGK